MTPEFHTRPGHGGAQAWATERLRFEPKGWQVDFRAELRRAVAALSPAPGVFHAEYRTPLPDRCDVENVLFYNVGVGAFGRLADRGLRFERGAAVPVCPVVLSGPALHFQRYAYGAEQGFLSWAEVATVATLVFDLPSVAGPFTPARVWAAARDGGRGWTGGVLRRGFGLRVVLDVANGRRLLSLAKPLLDGLIAALASYSGTHLEVVVARLAAQLGMRRRQVEHLLLDGSFMPLGPGEIVHPRGSGLQWAPADDRCVACEILLAPGRAGRITAELLHVVAR